MQHSEEERRQLERARLLAASRAMEARLPMQFGYNDQLSLSISLDMPYRSSLQSPLAAMCSYFRNPLAVSGTGLFSQHASMSQHHLPPPPLTLSVTRGLAQSTRLPVEFDYARGDLTADKLHASSKEDDRLQPILRAEALKLSYENENELPAGFKPGPNSVIIGRKKNCYTSMGNLRLRDICLMKLPAYSKCSKKKDKSDIVTDVVQIVRDSCPTGGAFVKQDETTGKWSEVKDIVARERVASIFRDFLHGQYRSSSKSKVAKRREMRVTDCPQSSHSPKEEESSLSNGKSES